MPLSTFRDRESINIFTKTLIAIGVVGFIFYIAKIVLYTPSTAYDIPDIVYNQIKTAKPKGITLVKISKHKKGMLINGTAKQNKHISLFMTAISKKGIGSPSLKSLMKSNKGNTFILMIRENK